jgi:hypothetical protein
MLLYSEVQVLVKMRKLVVELDLVGEDNHLDPNREMMKDFPVEEYH